MNQLGLSVGDYFFELGYLFLISRDLLLLLSIVLFPLSDVYGELINFCAVVFTEGGLVSQLLLQKSGMLLRLFKALSILLPDLLDGGLTLR